MPVPQPNPHATPTPTPRPAEPGHVTAGDYLTLECEGFKTDNPNLEATVPLGVVLEYIENLKNVVVASEL